MKKLHLALCISLALFCVSCLSVETTVEVNRDGSGKIIETVGVSKQIDNLMAHMSESEDEPAPTPFSEETFRKGTKQFGEGVEFVSMSESEGENMRYCKVEYSFKDINDVVIDQNQRNRVSFSQTIGAGNQSKQLDYSGKKQDEKKEPIRFTFSKDGDFSTLRVTLPASEQEEIEKKPSRESSPQMTEPQQAMLKAMFENLRFAARIKCNGAITETTASNVRGNTLTLWDIDFDKVMDQPEKLQRLNARKDAATTSLKEILGDIEGIEVEQRSEITVRFK